MIDRLKFLFRKNEFHYKDGHGVVVENYNPITDLVNIRHSKFGYVTHNSYVSRQDYLGIISGFYAEE